MIRQLRSPDEGLLFLGMLGFAAAALVLARIPLPRLEAILEPRGPRRPATPERVRQLLRCAELVWQLGKPLVRSTCLTRGLTLYYFLRRAGVEVSLCFGIAAVQGRWLGHCWLVRHGEPWLERQDPRSRFVEMYRFGGASGARLPGENGTPIDTDARVIP